MRVFRNIGGKALQTVDRAARHWLHLVADRDDVRAADVVALRLLALVCLVSLFVLPVLSVLLFSPALALPVAAALMLACLVCVTAAGLVLVRDRTHYNDTAEEALPEFSAFECGPGISFLCDMQGRISRTGGRDRHLLPASRAEPKGLTLAELVHVSDRIGVAQALDRLRQGAESATVEARLEHGLDQQGGRQFLSTILDMTAVFNGDGELSQVYVQMRDQTDAVTLREQVALHSAEAQSANEAKSRFLAAVSHELRTPLNAILGFSDVLIGEYFGKLENDRQREYVGLIRQSGHHLLGVVNAMLDMSRIEAGRYELLTESFELAEVVENCRAMLDLQARNRGVTLASRIPRNLGELVADPRAVQQILINLAGNAIKFTEAGGVVTIDALREGREIKLVVSDTGIGIPAEKISLLGQPFCQIQDGYTRNFEGTGLGLSLVKGLVGLHGGQFTIESRLGEGTVVTVVLPAEGLSMDANAPSHENAARAAVEEAVEFPPRLHAKANVAVTSRQGIAHDRAEAKSA